MPRKASTPSSKSASPSGRAAESPSQAKVGFLFEELQAYWSAADGIWTRQVLGIEIGRLAIALAIILGFLILRRLFTYIVIGRLQRWAERADTRLDERAVKSLAPPIRFIPLLIGLFVAVAYLGIEGRLASIGDNILRSLVVFTIFWLIYAAIGPFSFVFWRLEKILTGPMVDWLVRALRIATVFIGAAIIPRPALNRQSSFPVRAS